eukprot:6212773-Pleurochrysis_carterae.AAC.6
MACAAAAPQMFLACLTKAYYVLKEAQKWQWQLETLGKRFSNVLSPSQHELQPPTSPQSGRKY